MTLAMISVQRGGGVYALGRPPLEIALLGVPPLAAPGGVARLSNGSLAVTDVGGGALAIQSDGAWAVYGSIGAGSGQFQNPAAIAARPDAAYVADTGNDRIVRLVGLGPDGVPPTGWTVIGSTGRPGPTDDGVFRFSTPSGVAVDENTVVVADTGNGRLVAFPTVAFDSDPPTGWRVIELPVGPFRNRPFGVARGNQGWAVSDVANARIYLLDETMTVVNTLHADLLGLGVPAYLAFDTHDQLLIADPSANEVRLLKIGKTLRTLWRGRGSSPRYPEPLFERIGGVCAAAD